MSFSLPASSQRQGGHSTWPGMAMMVEAMMLLVFLVAAVLVVTVLFLGAASRSKEGQQLARAVAEATTTAERFAADPSHVAGTTEADDLEVVCEVDPEQTGAGTLYHATITVFPRDGETPLYVLESARYVPAAEPEGGRSDG